eukprot:sb/3468019/
MICMEIVRAYFLGLKDNVKCCGRTVTLIRSEPAIRSKLLECFLLNGLVFLLSLMLFDWLVVPVVLFIAPSHTSHWLSLVLQTLFRLLWVLPLYLISRLLNVFWFQEIADMVYKAVKRNKTRNVAPSISAIIADIVYSVVVQSVFLIQAGIASSLPVLGYPLNLLHMSLVYSMYGFEYLWFNQGIGVKTRVSLIHRHWPYYAGYGTLMAVGVSALDSYFMGVCVFSIMFPVLIVSAHFAGPTTDLNKCTPLPLIKPSIMITEQLLERDVRAMMELE